MRSTAIALAVASIVLIGVSACTSDGGTESVAATASGSPPGTDLFAGLRTPQGTLLLGGVFPRPNGATAMMLVTGDPLAVFADLARQAERAGLSLEPSETAAPCWTSTTVDRWWDDRVALGEPSTGRLTGLGCGAYGWTRRPDGTYRWLSLRMLVGVEGTPYLAHLIADTSVADSSTPLPTPAAPLALPAGASPVTPRPLSAVPRVGAPILRLNAGIPGGSFLVAKGSELVAPAIPSDCGGGGFVAVLRTRGDADSVIQEYVAELTADGLTAGGARRLDTPTGPATYVDASTPGGGTGSVTALPVVGGEINLMIDRCGD